MTKTQSPIRARMIEQMKIGNLAPVTQKEYLRTVSNLARDTRAASDRLDAEQVRAWVLGLIDRGLAPASTNARPPLPDRDPSHICCRSPDLGDRRRAGRRHQGGQEAPAHPHTAVQQPRKIYSNATALAAHAG